MFLRPFPSVQPKKKKLSCLCVQIWINDSSRVSSVQVCITVWKLLHYGIAHAHTQSIPHFTVPLSVEWVVRGHVAYVCQRDQSCHPSWWAAEGHSHFFRSAWTEPGSSAWACLHVRGKDDGKKEGVGRVQQHVIYAILSALTKKADTCCLEVKRN